MSKGMPDPMALAQAPRRKFRRGTTIKLAIGLGLIGLVLWFVDFNELVAVVLHSNPWYLAGAASLVYLDRGLMAYKWNFLLQAVNVRVPFSVLLRAYMVSPVAQVLLPSTIGADIFRLYSLARFKANTQGVFASMIMERVIGFVAIMALVLVSLGAAFYVMRDSWTQVVQLGWGVLATAVIGSVIVLAAYLAFRLFTSRLGRNPVIVKLNNIAVRCSEYRQHPWVVVKTFVWTFIEQLAPIGVVYLIVQALHVNVSLLELLVIIPLTVLALRLPISIDGIGVQEGLYVALFGFVGVSPSEALLLSAFRRAVQLLCALPWGLHYLHWERGRQPTLVEERPRAAQAP